MLIERRRYTLKPDGLPAFWQAQEVRGYDTVRPILERLIGYFSALAGSGDEVVHLYRYDSFEDWKHRLHGLYGVEGLKPYFEKVRALMTAQENAFLAPAPVEAASPHWNGERDWLPSHGPLFDVGAGTGTQVVEECTWVLRPGTVPAYWAAWQTHAQPALDAAAGMQLGTFVSLVGQQHEIVSYRVHAHVDDWQMHHAQLAVDQDWNRFLAAIAQLCVSSRRQLLRPAPIPQLSPLFRGAA